MAKRFKSFRDNTFDDWEDIRKEDRRKERQKSKRRDNRHNRIDEKLHNFKDFRNDRET